MDRPNLHAMVAFLLPFGLCTEPRIVPLEDAADYLRFGFTVLIDPADETDLVRWEQVQRSQTPQQRRRWSDNMRRIG